MRVALVLGWNHEEAGGVFSAVDALGKKLSAEGSFPVLVVGGGQAPSIRHDTDLLRSVVCKIYGPSSFGFCPALMFHLLSFKPDVVHIHGIGSFVSIVGLICIFLGLKVIVTPHGMIGSVFSPRKFFLKRLFVACFDRLLFKYANTIHVLTALEEEQFHAMLTGRYSNSKLAVIPNFIKSSARKDVSWEKIASEDGKLWLFYLGRIHEKKGLHHVFEALEMDLDFFCNKLHFDVYGWENQLSQSLANKYSDLVKSGCVEFKGPVGEGAKPMLQRYQFQILASRSEGLPMALLEGFSFGIPAVCTAACNISFAFDAGCAVLIQEDASDISKTLRRLCDLPKSELEDFEKNSFLFSKGYTWNALKKSYISLYK